MINPNLILLEQFAVGMMIGSFVRVALQRPLLSMAAMVGVTAAFVFCLTDPSCHQAQCVLDGALKDLSDAIAWWLSKPAFALGSAAGFAIAALPKNPSPV